MGSGIRPKREGFSPIPTDHRQRPANVEFPGRCLHLPIAPFGKQEPERLHPNPERTGSG